MVSFVLFKIKLWKNFTKEKLQHCVLWSFVNLTFFIHIKILFVSASVIEYVHFSYTPVNNVLFLNRIKSARLLALCVHRV